MARHQVAAGLAGQPGGMTPPVCGLGTVPGRRRPSDVKSRLDRMDSEAQPWAGVHPALLVQTRGQAKGRERGAGRDLAAREGCRERRR